MVCHAFTLEKGRHMKTPDSTITAESSAPNKRKFSAKSTATAAQYERIAAELRPGQKSTIDLRLAGIMMPAARIKEMNERLGFNIVRIDLRDLYDEQGFLHPRVAIYELVSVPEGTRVTGGAQ